MTATSTSTVYTATATTTGGRQGHAISSDGVLDLDLTPPGQGGTGTNPEQLFAVGWSACFNSALMTVARRARVDADAARVTAHIGLAKQEGGFGLTAELEVAMPGVEVSRAQELAEAAHEVCPYSKATRGNIPVTVTAVAA